MREPLVTVLPKTLELFRDNPPPDYLQWRGETKSKQRQLSALLEDNIESGMNWLRIEELRLKYTSAIDYCIEAPVSVGSVPVHILGITHSSDHSAEHVAEAIMNLNPKIVCIESCVDRTQARRTVQLPLVERYKCDWPLITSLGDDGGPSLEDLARHGLLDGSVEVAQFMVASGSVSGCPELTALYESKKSGNFSIHSVDVLESIKIIQNAAIDACGYTSRRHGDLSEGVLRQIIDEEGILSEYFRLMYGEKGMNGLNVQPSLLYRLLESRKRSPPFADFLLRELHRLLRGKQFWSRIFLRDLYMSLRIRRIAASASVDSGPVLVIVGGAHVEGIREILKNPPEIATHTALALSVLLDDADLLLQVWREGFGLDGFSTAIPNALDQGKAEMIAERIAQEIIKSSRFVSVWLEESGEWQAVDLGDVQGDEARMRILNGLVDGTVDPYTVRRLSAQDELPPKDV